MKLLLIDKDKNFLEEISAFLDRHDFDVVAVTNALEALIIINSPAPPDLIILEINLPGFDGFRLMEKLNEQEDRPCIPVLVLSEYNRETDRRKARELGAFDYIFKNQSLEDVLIAVKKISLKLQEAKKLRFKNVVLSGKLSEISIPDILQIIQMSRKTGLLEIVAESKSGTIWLQNGELVAAESEGYCGEAALYYMFSWKEGVFNFGAGNIEKPTCNLNLSLNSALLNGTKFIDEIDDICVLVPIHRKKTSLSRMGSEARYYYSLIDNKSTINELAAVHNLNIFICAYYYLKFEQSKVCRLIEKKAIPNPNSTLKTRITDGLKILIVDDSRIMLKALEGVLKQDARIAHIEKALSGQEALTKLKKYKPDVVTLDVNMPGMDGITALKHIMLFYPVPVVMLSAFTKDGSETTFDALRYGAVDFYTKPVNINKQEFEQQKNKILAKIKMAAGINVKGIRRVQVKKYRRKHNSPNNETVERLVIMGAANGSYGALLQLLPDISGDFNAPIVVLQYIDEVFIQPFVDYLNKMSELKHKVAQKEEVLQNGFVYFIPNNQYGSFERKDSQIKLVLNKIPFDGQHEHSINIAMFSASETFGGSCIGLLLSGDSEDGAEGLREIRRHDGYTLVQDPATCIQTKSIVAALKNNAAMEVIPLNEIAKKIYSFIMKKPIIEDA